MLVTWYGINWCVWHSCWILGEDPGWWGIDLKRVLMWATNPHRTTTHKGGWFGLTQSDKGCCSVSVRAGSQMSQVPQATWGQSVQSQPLRAWKLGLSTSHRSQVPSPKPLEVTLWNLSRWEHGSWDLSLHTCPKSQATWGFFVQSQSLRVWTLGLITSHKSQATWGYSMQSQSLRAWKLGLITSHRSQVPSHLRLLCAISVVESMEVGTYHLPLHTGRKSQVPIPSHLRSIRPISAIERMETGTYHFTHVPSPKSQILEVYPCNLSHWEHVSWDLPLYMGLKS